MPSRITLRRASVLLATSALTVSGLALTSAPASAVPDPGPATDATTWLVDQLTDGLIHNVQFDFDDLGLSADVAFGLDEIPGQDATIDEITNAIEPRAEAEWYTSTFGGVTTTYAGSLGKALVLAQTAGAPTDPTDFGGVDLVTSLEALVASAAPISGRIEDVNNDFGDANVIGQSFAVRGLDVAGSSRAEDATNFLLKQQCGAGYFRLEFTQDKEAARQRCVDGAAGSEPDTDATALVMINLLATGSTDPDVVDAVAAADEWLLEVQRADGSFGGGPTTEAPNTNSTGLAAWALSRTNQAAAAERAASWVRGRQAVNLGAGGACAPWDAIDEGAIAYDQAAHVAGQANGITIAKSDQWRRATAQALPGLALTPAATSDLVATTPAGFRQAGTDARVAVTGAAPGAAVCASLGTQRVLGAANAAGNASLVVTLPGGTATRTVSVSDGVTSDTAQYDVLGSLRVPFTLKPSVARGKQQVVQVSGLEPGEAVRVTFRGRRVDNGVANGQGRFNASFPVTGKAGRATIEVIGQFPVRHASKTFVVTA